MEYGILLQSILICSIQGNNYVKNDATKDLNMDPRKILSELKKAHKTIEDREFLDNCASTSPTKSWSRTIQRGSKGE